MFTSSDNDSEYEFVEEEDPPNEGQGTFSPLNNMLNDDDFNNPIQSSFVVSKSEVLLAILQFALMSSLPNIAIQNLCKMMNSFCSSKFLPDTRNAINKLFNTENGVQYHAVCSKCNVYIREFKRTERNVYCEMCKNHIPVKGSDANFFVLLNVEDQIRNLLQKNEDYYDSVMNDRREDDGKLRDISDGAKYKQFVRSLPLEDKKSYATCIFNSDGSPVFKSSTYSIWPIQIIINELPVDIRNNEPISWALWFGRNKPNMTIFLDVFVDKMKKSSTEGILCKIKTQSKNIKLYPLCCCVDSVSRAPMQGVMQFNGHYGCNWCLHHGVPILQKSKKTIKYPLLDYVPERRNMEDTLRHMDEAVATGKPVFGVKGYSPLVKLPSYDIIDGMLPDEMHLIDLGLCRQFANYWFGTTGHPYSLGNKETTAMIDRTLISLQLPKQIAKLSRPLKDRKYWSARDWQN